MVRRGGKTEKVPKSGKPRKTTVKKSKLSKDEINRLFLAEIKNGDVKKIRALIKKGADVNYKELNSDTPLGRAIYRDDVNISLVKLLIKNGANVNYSNKNKTTELHAAAEYGDMTVIKLLLKHGADPTLKNDRGETPSLIAEIFGHYDVKKLLDAKVKKLNKK